MAKPTTATKDDAARNKAADDYDTTNGGDNATGNGDDKQQPTVSDAEGEDGITRVIQSKLSARYLGNPRKGASLEEGQTYLVGFISGIAYDTKNEVLPSGEASISLTGSFEGETADGKKIVRSGRLFLPSGIHDEVVALVRTGSPASFSLEIRTKPAKNAAGYEYEVHSLLPVKEDDGAAIRRNLIAQRRQKLLANMAKAA